MNKNKKQHLSLLRCAKTLGRALDAPVTMCGKKSEQTLTREQRCEIYSLLDKVIENAQIAKRECLKEAPLARVVCNNAWENLEALAERIGKTILSEYSIVKK